MRILIAVHGYPPTFTGGAEREAARAAQTLAARGHAVMVLAIDSLQNQESPLSWTDTLESGVTVRRLHLDLDSTGDRARAEYDNPLTGRATADAIAGWRPEVLHLYSGYLLSSSVVSAAVEHGIPVVVSLMDYWWICHRFTLVRPDGTRCDGPSPDGCARCRAEVYRRFRWPARVVRPAADAMWSIAGTVQIVGERLGVPLEQERAAHLRAVLAQTNALIAASHFLAGVYARHGVEEAKIRVWRQGVDLDHRPVHVPSHELRVAYIGQVKHHKGAHVLLDAWNRLRGSRPRRLTLYGSSSGEDAYAARVRREIDRLDGATWAGEFTGSDVWNILAETDVVVVPSRWVENSPNSILEAQAAGVPVVGTDLGGVAELVQHDINGLLFRVDDAGDLARQLQRLLDEPQLLERLRATPAAFRTTASEVDRLESLYESVVSDHALESACMHEMAIARS